MKNLSSFVAILSAEPYRTSAFHPKLCLQRSRALQRQSIGVGTGSQELSEYPRLRCLLSFQPFKKLLELRVDPKPSQVLACTTFLRYVCVIRLRRVPEKKFEIRLDIYIELQPNMPKFSELSISNREHRQRVYRSEHIQSVHCSSDKSIKHRC